MACYAAKASAAATQTSPTGWPGGWTWPGPPFPPGWPIDDPLTTGTLTVTGPTVIGTGDGQTWTARILAAGADTSTLNYHNILVSAATTAATVQVKTTEAGTNADSVNITVNNYTGSRYGFSQALYFDVDGIAAGTVVTVTCTINSIEANITGTDTAAVADYGVWGGSATAAYWKDGP